MREELKKLINSIAAQPSLSAEDTDALMSEAFTMASTPDEKAEAGAYLKAVLDKRKRPDVDVKGILGEVSELLNLSHVAKRYLGKDRTWLYQRLNGSIVNGKPAAFSQSELRILSDSLNEISHIIQQTSFKLTQSNS